MSNDDVRRFRNYFWNTQPLIADVLAVKSVMHNFHCQPIKLTVHSSRHPTLSATYLNTSELVELLQRSAVEHVTTVRQLESRDFGSVVTIVTTDFEALHAYKHSDYRRCLQLSIHRTYACCCMLTKRTPFRHIQSLFSYWMMTLSH